MRRDTTWANLYGLRAYAYRLSANPPSFPNHDDSASLVMRCRFR